MKKNNRLLYLNCFLIIVITAYFTGCTLNTKETFLIPEGYVGRVTVSFNHHKDGVKQEFEPETYIFRIPPDGNLNTAHVNDRCDNPIRERKFFYVNSKGEKTNIPVIDNPRDVHPNERNKIKIYHFKTDFVAKKYPPYNILYRCLHTFIVDSYQNLDRYNQKSIKDTLIVK